MTKIEALLKHLGSDFTEDDISESTYDDTTFEVGLGKYPDEYQVLTEDEADTLWEESLDNYLEECIYPELPDNMASYFDDEKWKRDARMGGRCHAIARYDGCEHEVGEYIIIRQN